MILVIPKPYEDGTPLFEADLDSMSDAIENVINGNIGDDNLIDGGVTSSKLADSSVVAAKLATDAVIEAKIKDGEVALSKLKADAVAFLVPTGTVLPYAGDTAPSGYLLCDGSAVSRTTYADLYAKVADRFGEGDASTTFNVPDLRGRFVRGRDAAAGNDPDAGTRSASGTGGATGDAVGSYQADKLKTHEHSVPSHSHDSGTLRARILINGANIEYDVNSTASWNADTAYGVGASSTSPGGPFFSAPAVAGNTGTQAATDTGTPKDETGEGRPKNIYLNYIIKT